MARSINVLFLQRPERVVAQPDDVCSRRPVWLCVPVKGQQQGQREPLALWTFVDWSESKQGGSQDGRMAWLIRVAGAQQQKNAATRYLLQQELEISEDLFSLWRFF